MKDTLIIVPTFNEIDNIELLLAAIFNRYQEVHVLVVDDNSPDGTAEKVSSITNKFPKQLFIASF